MANALNVADDPATTAGVSLEDTVPELEIPVIDFDAPPPVTSGRGRKPVQTLRTFDPPPAQRPAAMSDPAAAEPTADAKSARLRKADRRADSSADEEAAGPSDARLIEQTRRGETDAFGTLVKRYERRLSRVIARFVTDADLIDDLTQETFLRVYERLDQYDASRRFGPWLFRVGVNLTLDHLRRKKRRKWTAFFSEQSHTFEGRSFDPGVADPREAEDLQQEVRRVLEDVPEKYRTVLVLRDLENFSTSEIAAILDRKEATIRWRLAEARSRFEALWSKRTKEPSR